MTNGSHTHTQEAKDDSPAQEVIPLSQKLREETKELHFIANQILDLILVKRRMMLDTYGVFLGAYYHIYKALEEHLEKAKTDDIVGPVHMPTELSRLKGLEEDLEFFLGEDWNSKVPFLPSVSRYVERLKEISEERPELLLAHSYVRYMGDLAGSQLLPLVIRHLYRLPSDGTGVQFYNFSQINDMNGFKASYKHRMDALKLNDVLEKELIEEAKLAFQLNINVMKEIDGTAPSRGIFTNNPVERACSMLIDGTTGLPPRKANQLGRSASLRNPPRFSMASNVTQSGNFTGVLRRPEVDASGKVVPPQIQRLKQGHSVFNRRSLAEVGSSLVPTFSPWSSPDGRKAMDSSV